MIRKPKTIIRALKGKTVSMPLADGGWCMMKAPADGYIFETAKGVYTGVFVTDEELKEVLNND